MPDIQFNLTVIKSSGELQILAKHSGIPGPFQHGEVYANEAELKKAFSDLGLDPDLINNSKMARITNEQLIALGFGSMAIPQDPTSVIETNLSS
jgi:hypothetical protein